MEKRNKSENSRDKHHDRLLYENYRSYSKYFIFFFFKFGLIPIYSYLLLTHYVTIEKTRHICSFNHITFVISQLTYLNNTHV